MRRILLFFGLLVCMPAMMAVGLGPGLFSDSGGGGGVLHPISGVDSQICIGENSDYDGNTVCTNLDATTDMIRDQDYHYTPLAVTGQRWLRGFINDTSPGHGGEREAVRWFNNSRSECTGDSTLTGNCHWLSGSTNPTNLQNGEVSIFASAGGRLKADIMSVRLLSLHTNVDVNDCDFQIYKAESKATNTFDPSTQTESGWDLCGDALEMGPGSNNLVGEGDATVSGVGDGFAMPVGSCECTQLHCKMILTVVDRTAGSCDWIQGAVINLLVSEAYP